MMIRRSKIFGFTLLELLTVIAISAVVSTIGLNVLFKVQSHYLKINKQVQLSNKVEHALDQMQKDFEELLPSRLASEAIVGEEGRTKNREYQNVSDCEDDVVTLPVSVVDPGTGQQVTQTVAYYIDRTEALPRLMFATAPLGETPVRDKAQAIISGAWQLRVEYSDGQDWLPAWTQSTHPESVRVHIVVSDQNRKWEQVSRKRVFPIRVK